MNGSRIMAMASESAITDVMIAQQTADAVPLCEPARAEEISFYLRTGRVAESLMASGTECALSVTAGTRADGDTATGNESLRQEHQDGSEADDAEITSDDSGDFDCLTRGLDDAEGYRLVRALIAHDKQQEREIAALRRECQQLESQESTLWRQAVTVGQTRRRSQRNLRRRLYGDELNGDGSANSRESVRQGRSASVDSGTLARASGEPAVPVDPRVEIVDEVNDEFEDVWIDMQRTCRYLDPDRSYSERTPYRYAMPDTGGDFTTVFEAGFLYRSATAEGVWVFFNDSEKYTMEVKYLLGSTSEVAPGPHAVMRRLATKEIEMAVQVAPEETEVLLLGEVNGFRNLSRAVPVGESFINGRVEMHNAPTKAALSALATKLGKSSPKYLTPDEVLVVCRTEGSATAFVDPDFPPCSESIYRRQIDTSFLWNEPWRRPEEFLSGADAAEVRLFRGQVQPCDACAGDGGDVYFSSAAAILAEFPMLVRALFRYPRQHLTQDGRTPKEVAATAATEAKSERHAHAYRVSLNSGGWWHSTLLDDYLPASLLGPTFGRCEDDLRKLWFPMLQKGYAKAHGSYAAIQCGDVAEALQDLTGFPAARLDEEWGEAVADGATDSDTATLFTRLQQRVQAGYVVCLSLPDEGPDNGKAAAMGFVYGASYCVLAMVEQPSELGGTRRLVKVRCPNLRRDWGGLWCPESVLWQQEPALLRRCRATPGDTPVDVTVPLDALDEAWLDWSEEVLKLFEGGATCYTRFDLHDYRVRGVFDDGIPSVVLEVSVQRGAPSFEAYCTLSQRDDRGAEPGSMNASLSPLMLSVSKSEGAVTDSAGAAYAGASSNVPVKHNVEKVCSTDPDVSTEKLNFIVGRDVALKYTFEAPAAGEGEDGGTLKSAQVYYIIPRSRGAMQGKQYSIGFLSSTAVDGSSVQIRLVKLQEKCEVFRNKRNFTSARVEQPARPVHYQRRSASGDIFNARGYSLVFK